MSRGVKKHIEGYLGACKDACYRIDPTPADQEWLRELNTGQRVMFLMDFLYHMSMAQPSIDEVRVQKSIEDLEDLMMEAQ